MVLFSRGRHRASGFPEFETRHGPKRFRPVRDSYCSGGRGTPSRRGTAIAELAICLPLLVMIVFVSIELCNAKHLKQAITEASYEGALVGSQARAKETDIVQRIQTVLAARNITDPTITVDGNGDSFDALGPGKLFSVRVVVPTQANLLAPLHFVTAAEIGAEVAGHKQE